MHTVGWFLPESEQAARDRYEALGSTAQLVVRETTKAMAFDRAEYDERVTSDVVETAREVLFAEQLQVTVGTREEFEAFRDDRDAEFEVFGSENVDNVAWHAPSFTEGVAATFQDEEAAAVGTLRRQALAHVYRDVV
jgi:hypothetical protein